MTLYRSLLLFVLVASVGCADGDGPALDGSGDPAATVLGDATQTICADGTGAPCSTLPTDMAGHAPGIGYNPNTNAGAPGTSFTQTYVDYFGWQAFVALNWPLDADGQPSTTETITSDVTSPRVWSGYETKAALFGLGEAGCAADDGDLALFRTSKFGLGSFIESGTSYPLLDRNGNYVLYDVRINPTEVTYLQSNTLTTKAGQAAFGQTYDFPGGSGSDVGSIEIKTSWRILTDADDTGDFYTSGATITVPAANSATGSQLCLDVTVGLVGMHIMQKFSAPGEFAPFWAWATFEHVDNAPLADDAPVSQLNASSSLETLGPPSCTRTPDTAETTQYSFYDAACSFGDDPGAACEVNEPPPLPADSLYLWASSPPFGGAYMTRGGGRAYGTQVARCFDIYDSARQTTAAYHTALGDGPWSQYMLVGAQWAAASSTNSGPLAALTPYAAPIYLTNTTMETYIQVDSVQSVHFDKGSCIACHNGATDTAGNNSNLSFLPGNAQ